MSGWREACPGGGWNNGEDIRPLTKEAAFEWAQEHLKAGEVEALFPDMIVEA